MKNKSKPHVRKPSLIDLIHILCVEDNAAFLKALKSGLERHGFEVVTAIHGLDALHRFKKRSGKFGAIVTCDDMPEINGLEFIRSVREQGFRGPIFLLSENSEPACSEAYYRQQISGFLQKPFEIATLAALIEVSLLFSIVLLDEQIK
jgi:two-component system chemotaxis response regulator CheY